jgi:energy-coupling factor transporter ATP-binding protein EcfA2
MSDSENLDALGVQMELAVWRRQFVLDSDAPPSSKALDDLEVSISKESVETFVARLDRVPNLHAMWALAHANSHGTYLAKDFATMWSTSAARKRFDELFAAVRNREPVERCEGLLAQMRQDDVVAPLMWIALGMTGSGKSTLISCMRSLANHDNALAEQREVPLPRFAGSTAAPTTESSIVRDMTMRSNKVFVGDTRGWLEDNLLSRMLASLAIASAIASYGFDSNPTNRTTSDASGPFISSSLAIVVVDASGSAPLWLRALRTDADGSLSIDHAAADAREQQPLTSRESWSGIVSLAHALDRCGVKMFVLLTKCDKLEGDTAQKCATMKRIFDACPLSVLAKDFLILPDSDEHHGLNMTRYTKKKVAYVMLRMLRLNAQHHNFLAASLPRPATAPSAQPVRAQVQDRISRPREPAPIANPAAPTRAPLRTGLSIQTLLVAVGVGVLAVAFYFAFVMLHDLRAVNAKLAMMGQTINAVDAKFARFQPSD